MGSLAFEIREIVPWGVMITALDLPIAATDGGVDRLVGFPIKVAVEAVGSLAARAGETGRLTGILLKIVGLYIIQDSIRDW